MELILQKLELSREDTEYAERRSQTFQKRAVELGGRPTYVSKISDEESLRGNYLGALGEIAVAKYLGLMPFGYPDFPLPGGPDVTFPDGKVGEVQTTKCWNLSEFYQDLPLRDHHLLAYYDTDRMLDSSGEGLYLIGNWLKEEFRQLRWNGMWSVYVSPFIWLHLYRRYAKRTILIETCPICEVRKGSVKLPKLEYVLLCEACAQDPKAPAPE